MWIPERFVMGRDDTVELLTGIGAADLITPSAGGVEITYLPWVFDDSAGEHGVLRSHLARQNPHAAVLASEPDVESVVVAHGVDCYVSPRWYAPPFAPPPTDAKPESGLRQVPTWNYVVAHVYGRVTVHDDFDWVLAQVGELSAQHEAAQPRPWTPDDAPADFVAGLCRAIVGIELTITRIEAKAKLSQNKSPSLVAGVVAGLRSVGDQAAADAVVAANAGKQWPAMRARYR